MPILEEIGLSKREAEIYETLIRLGNSPMSDLLSATGLHSQVVYRVVDSLERKGLIIRSRRAHKTFVRAEDPKKLMELERQRLETLQKKIVTLAELQKPTKETVVRVAYGNEAVQNFRLRAVEELDPGETIYIIGAADRRYYEAMGVVLEEFHRRRTQKRIRLKLIGYEPSREFIAQRDGKRKLIELRYLPAQFPILSSTNIAGDKVAILIWSPEPIVITIESADVAESYRQYFSTLWRIAQP